MNNLALEQLLNQALSVSKIKDYAPNGLQVEGRAEVKRLVTGVTASLPLIERAIALNADAILVHHGYFWKSEPLEIRGMKAKRIKALLDNNLNLYAYHLPLDVHPEWGNNAQLAQALGIENLQGLEPSPFSIPMQGEFAEPISAAELRARITEKLGRMPLVIDDFHSAFPQKLIKKIGLCTGGGQGYLDLAANAGLDAFISGEASEQTTHSAREQGIYYFGAGHHATERGGVQALGRWLAEAHGFDVHFIDIDNPV